MKSLGKCVLNVIMSSLMVSALISQQALAKEKIAENTIVEGTVGGGGGNAIGDTLLDDSYTELADLPGFGDYSKAFETLQSVSPRFAARVKKVALSLNWILIEHDLPNIGHQIGFLVDSNQVAYQVGKNVYIDMQILNRPTFKLSSKSKLIMHEILLYILRARNDAFNLSLTKAQIHDHVRQTVAGLFAFDKRKRQPTTTYSEHDVQDLLRDNQFGYWETAINVSQILRDLPQTVKNLAQYFVNKCDMNILKIEKKDLEQTLEVISNSCKNCWKFEFDQMMQLFKSSTTSQPRNITYALLNGFKIDKPFLVTEINLSKQTCEIANELAALPSAQKISQAFSAETCKSWNEKRNLCDAESFPTELTISTYFDVK